MIWYCGGHGQCLDPGVNQDAQTAFLTQQTLPWLDTYVKNKGTTPPPPVSGPTFEWVDQNGNWWSSNLLPNAKGFIDGAIPVSGKGGTLVLVPIIGGSGPQTLANFPVSLGLGSKADNAVNVLVTNPDNTTDYVVGAPQLSFTYSGVGTSRTVYAQLVDNQTGRVVGNIVTPIPVTLDGKTHTVDVPMEDIAYTMAPGDTLTLQIVSSATAYEEFTSYGVINVSDVDLSLPTADPKNVQSLPIPANDLATV